MKTRILTFTGAMAALTACVPQGVVRHEMHAMPQDGWRRQDTITLAIDSTEAGYRLDLCMRMDDRQAYDTLWLWVNGDTLTVPCHTKKKARLRQYEYTLGTARKGNIKIIHLMRRDPLPGMREMGIKLSCTSWGTSQSSS